MACVTRNLHKFTNMHIYTLLYIHVVSPTVSFFTAQISGCCCSLWCHCFNANWVQRAVIPWMPLVPLYYGTVSKCAFFPLLISKSDLVLWWRLFSSLVYTAQTVYGMIMCLCHCYSRADNIFSLLCEGEFLANIQYISVTLGRLLLSWVFIMCMCMHL